MATLIEPDGTARTVKPATGKSFTLAELQKLVGGYIEIFPGTRFVLVDEEGLLKNLPINIPASLRVGGYQIVGNALFLDAEEMGE